VGVIIVTMIFLAGLSFFVVEHDYLYLESTYVRSDVNPVAKNIDSENQESGLQPTCLEGVE
jgi:hypothetical protein